MDVSDSKAGLSSVPLNLSELLANAQTDKISLKSTYEPEKMADFNPSVNFSGARLVQQALFDENTELVPPWKAPSVFKKGALVAVEAQLSVYHFMEDKIPKHVYSLLKTPLPRTDLRFK